MSDAVLDTDALKQERAKLQKRIQEINTMLRGKRKRTAPKTPRGRSADSLPTRILAVLKERGPMRAGDLLAIVVPAHDVKITSARTLIASMCASKELVRTGSKGSYVYAAA